MNLASHGLPLVPGDTCAVFMHAHDRRVDHLDGGIMGSGEASMIWLKTPARCQRTKRFARLTSLTGGGATSRVNMVAFSIPVRAESALLAQR